MAGGRPTKYDEEFILAKSEEYLAACEDEYEEFHKTRGEKSDSYDRLVRVHLPTLEGLALHIGVHKDTIQEWCKEHEEFSVFVKRLLTKQAKMLLENGLSGDYNPMIAKLILSKHGYTEKTETDITTRGESLNDARILALTNELNALHKRGGITSNGESSSALGTEVQNQE